MIFPMFLTEFRSGIGSLQWVAGTTRGDLAADTSLLQKPPKELTVGDLKEINKVLKYARATANAYVRVNPLDLKDLVFIAYGGKRTQQQKPRWISCASHHA